MNIYELLHNVPAFQGATLLAGDTATENEITSIMVLESIDIENWSKPGQLLLSSYFAFKSLSDEELCAFVSVCSKVGIGGIAIKTGRLIMDIPPFFIKCCEEHEVPLIWLPENVRYDNLILSVLEPIMTQMIEDRRATEYRAELMLHLLTHGGPDDEADCQKMLSELGIGDHHQYKLCLLKTKSENGDMYIAHIASWLQKYLEHHRYAFVLHHIAGAFIIILNYPPSSAPEEGLIRKMMAGLCKALKLPPSDVYAILSSECDFSGISSAYAEISDTARLLGDAHLLRNFTDCSALGIYRLFLSNKNRQLIGRIIDPKHAVLYQDSKELWQTLSVYVEERGSCTATASRLFVHPKTVKYRIEKIWQKYGIDGNDVLQTFSILLDDKLFVLRENNGA